MSAELSAALEELTVVYQKSAERTVKDLQAQSDFGPPLSGFGLGLRAFFLDLSPLQRFCLMPRNVLRVQSRQEESLRYAVTNFFIWKRGFRWSLASSLAEDPSTLEG